MASCEGPLKVLRVSANSLRSPCTVSSSNLRDFRGLESPLESRGLLARCARPQRGSCEAATEPLRSPMQGPHARLLRSPPRSPCQSPARFARPQRGSCEAAAEPLRGPMQGSMRGSCEAPLRSPCESPARSATPQRGSCEAAVRRAGTLRISRTSVGFSRTSWTSANSADPSGISREFFADLARMHRGSLAEASWTPCEPRRPLADFADFGAVSSAMVANRACYRIAR